MTFGELTAKIDGSCYVNIYDSYTKRYNAYSGFICTIVKHSPICKLFSEKEVIAFGTTSTGRLNVAIKAGDEE